MLTTKEINQLYNTNEYQYYGYEDFNLVSHFKNKSNSGTKFNSRFDDLFEGLHNQYNIYPRNKFNVSQQMNELKKLNTTVDFNDFNSSRIAFSKTHSIKELMQTLDKLTSRSINEDLSANLEGWMSVADTYGVDISAQLMKASKLTLQIISDDVFGPVVGKIEKTLEQLNKVNYELNEFGLNRKPSNEEMAPYIECCFQLKRTLHFFENYYNQDKLLEKLISDSKVFEHIESYKEIRNEILDTLKQNVPDFSYSNAYSYVKSMNNASDIQLMLLEQGESKADYFKDLKNIITLDDERHKVSNVYFFNDNSIALKKNNEWAVVDSKLEKIELVENIFCIELAQKLKRSPTIAKLFVKKLKEDFDMERAIVAADTYLANEVILKSKDYDLLDEIKELLFEDLDDSMTAFVRKHKIEQYGLSIASKKYKNLYDEESFEIIGLLYDLKVPASELQDSLGKKLAAFKTSDDFNKGLKSLYMIHSGFNVEAVLNKANSVNAEIIKNDDNQLIIKIENFEQSSTIGSASWCISRSNVHFKSYTEDAQQYFIYDFNKEPTKNDSIMGVTLNNNGTHSAAHFKNDDQLHDNDEFKKLQLDILRNDLKSYPALTEELKTKLDSNTELKKQSLLKNIASKIFNR